MDIRFNPELSEPFREEKDITFSNYLEACDFPIEEFKTESFTMVIFGGAGDLSKRKLLPTLFHLFIEKKLPDQFSILSYGFPENLADEEYRFMVRESMKSFEPALYDEKLCLDFLERIYHLGGSFDNNENYIQLKEKINQISFLNKNKKIECLYYLAVPPTFIEPIISNIGEVKLNNGYILPRIIVEKPFGVDRKSAAKLNKKLLKVFKENQIFRMDHYLGKETVQNIIYFRFANSIFEPLWNRNFIDSIQITVAEDLGIEHRGSFYEEAGVIRDIVQNHLLQLIALVAMEPPVGFEADLIRDEKVKVFKSISSMTDGYIDKYTIRGQYGESLDKAALAGYRSEKNVDKESNTATYFAGKFMIDNWRWAGVPFYVRTGKRLKKRLTDIVIQFKKPPLQLFGRTCEKVEPSFLVLTIQPEESIILKISVKYPNDLNRIRQVKMNFSYNDQFNVVGYPPYSRLILDCLKGDLTLFVREDGIDSLWKIVDPIIKRWENTKNPVFPNYAAGSWGPESADLLLKKEGRHWHTDMGGY